MPVDPGEAAGQVGLAKGLAVLPRTAGRLAAGELTVGQARAAATVAGQVPGDPQAVSGVDAVTAEAAASGADSRQIRQAVDEWAHRYDEALLSRREADAHRRRRLRLWRLADGGLGSKAAWTSSAARRC